MFPFHLLRTLDNKLRLSSLIKVMCDYLSTSAIANGLMVFTDLKDSTIHCVNITRTGNHRYEKLKVLHGIVIILYGHFYVRSFSLSFPGSTIWLSG